MSATVFLLFLSAIVGFVVSGGLLIAAICDIIRCDSQFAYWFRWYVLGQRSIEFEGGEKRLIFLDKEGRWRGVSTHCWWYLNLDGAVRHLDTGEKQSWLKWKPLYPKDNYWVYKNLTPFQRKVIDYIKAELP